MRMLPNDTRSIKLTYFLLTRGPSNHTRSIRPLEWWDSLAFCFVQCVAYHSSVAQIDLSVWFLLERQAVLHPLVIQSVGEVLSSVRATRFLPVCSCNGRLRSTPRQHQVLGR